MIELKRLGKDQSGSYVIEWALLFLPLMTLLLGMIEYGYYAYSKARVEEALRQVSRLSATGIAADLTAVSAALDARFEDMPFDYNIDVKSYKDFNDVGQPEPMTSDVNNNGSVDPGDCYIDINDNDVWDADSGVSGIGGADDIVYFGLQVSYDPIFTLSQSVFGNKMYIDANAAIKNEPYANATSYTSAEKCIPVT